MNVPTISVSKTIMFQLTLPTSTKNNDSSPQNESKSDTNSDNVTINFITNDITFHVDSFVGQFELPLSYVEKFNNDPWPPGFRRITTSQDKYGQVDLLRRVIDCDKCFCSETDPCSSTNGCANFGLNIECTDEICNAPNNCKNRQFHALSMLNVGNLINITRVCCDFI